jgi:hypothetical protein
MFYPNSDKYDGEIWMCAPHGYGVMYKKNGEILCGEWIGGVF